MGPTEVNGLPAHPLFAHAVVVLVPLTCLALVVAAVRSTWLARLGVFLPLLAAVTLVLVPLTTNAGEWLEERVPKGSAVERHTDLGETLLPWVIALLVLAVLLWLAGRRTAVPQEPGGGGGRVASAPVRVAAIVLSVAVAVGALVQVYRIGDSGAAAVWHGKVSRTPLPGRD